MTRRQVLTSSWPPIAGAVIATAFILHHHDVRVADLAKFALYLGVVVAPPGVLAWRFLLAHLHGGLDGSEPLPVAHRRPTWLEDLSLGSIFGFGLQLPCYLLGVWIGVPLLFLALPLLALGLSVATPLGRRVWTMPTAKVDFRVSWALAAVVVYATAWLAKRVFSTQPLTLPISEAHHDEGFHQALIAELLHRFPPQIPYLLGTRLEYHWFVHAQIAADHWATQLSTTVLLRELMPTTVAALAVVGVAAVALRLTGRPSAAVIAPALLVAGGFGLMAPHYDWGNFTESYLSQRFVSSPSQAYGFMMALPAIMLIVEVLRPGGKPHRLAWVALALSLLALSGSKATFVPIFLCGAVATWLFKLVFDRTFDKMLAALVAVLLAVTVFSQVVLLGGNSGALSLDPLKTVTQALVGQGIVVTTASTVVMTMTMLIGWLLYGVGAVGLVHARLWRDTRALWMFFSILAGVAVALLFFRSGRSQLWFQRSVAELVVLVSAWGITKLLPEPLTRRVALRLLTVAGAAGLGAFVVSRIFASIEGVDQATYPEIIATAATPFVIAAVYLVVRRSSRRNGLARIGPAVPLSILLGLGLSHAYSFAYDTVSGRSTATTVQTQFAPGGYAAARWIESHSNPDDIVATNVHSRLPSASPCDIRSFWIAAYTERRIVVEGWGYTPESDAALAHGGCRDVPHPPALKANDAAFRHPSVSTVGRLVHHYDVRYLFVSRLYPADIPALKSLHSLLQVEFHNRNYVVFKVRD